MGNYIHLNKCVQFGEYSLKYLVITNSCKQGVLTTITRMSTCAFIRDKKKKWVSYHLLDVKKMSYKSDQIKSLCHIPESRKKESSNINEHIRSGLDSKRKTCSNERLDESRTLETAEHVSDDNDFGCSGDLLQSSDISPVVGNGNRVTKHAGKRNQSRFEDIVPPPGTDMLYGISPCLLALEVNRRQVNNVYVTSSFKKSARPAVQKIMQRVQDKHLGNFIHEVHRKDLDKLSKGRPHQGICLETSRIHFKPLPEDATVDEQELQEPLVYLAMDQILDPMNMGAIIRSAYYLGVDRIIASKHSCCSLTPVVSKASSGAMEIMPVYSTSSLLTFIMKQRDIGWEIVGSTCAFNNWTHTLNVSSAASFKLSKPTVVVIGGEGSGLPDSIQNACCQLLTIPAGRELHTSIDSLNVSVATGILLQSILQQKQLPHRHL
ncbi:rRNA methyltransferase 1, mitochondrial-like isoform X2 [Patiria miniata]|uniref:rRNA methyltransferase 1, mitochondrial n=1 Tax=Patiria miniata TaxID=46514 RepID=A0A913ZT63_PATMI|nr:rRNA methyltransferase 1, mitochondrial-like isoform X2 [Patiria miniata]